MQEKYKNSSLSDEINIFTIWTANLLQVLASSFVERTASSPSKLHLSNDIINYAASPET